MKHLTKLLLVVIGLMATTAGVLAESELEEFSDVPPGQSHYVAINYLKEQGIISGYDDNTFKPNQKINRAEALKMITLATGVFSEEEIKKLEVEEQPFIDTPPLEWYTKYLVAAKEEGLIDGYDDGLFRPNQTINLAETLKIFLGCYDDLEYPNIEEFLFIDTPADAWFVPYTSYAGMHGLINITDSNEIWPAHEMTRGYVAEIIYRMLMKEEIYEFGKATFYGEALQGNYTASGEIFDYNLLTAAHKYLPFQTLVEVTNLANNESVVVRITDRGPYGYGRIIDLSTAAFDEIAWLGTGVIKVQCKIVHYP